MGDCTSRFLLHVLAAVLLFSAFETGVSRAQSQPQQAAKPAPTDPRPAQIDKTDLLILIRQTLAALDQSNKSGNYTVLRELSGPGFASINDAALLSQIFRSQRDRGLDYSGALVYEPQINVGPEITKDGLLHFGGFFPSPTTQIKFEMYFQPVNGQWRLFGLAADITPGGPAAPPAPQPPAPTPPQTTSSNTKSPGTAAPKK